MILRAALLALLFTAQSGSAQQWTAETPADISYAGGWAMAPVGLSVSCAASRDGGGRTALESLWFEASITAPWHFILNISDHLVPEGPERRSDMILFLDQTGYRLPEVGSNELAGGWEVQLSMTDPVFAALQRASRIVLQIGAEAAWEIPAAGAGAAISQFTGVCAATWQQTGHPAPAGLQQPPAQATILPQAQNNDFTLPAQVTAYMHNRCNGPATIQEGGVQAGDLDGDGTPDVVLDWRDLPCPGERLSSFCGAANCEITIFLSTRGYSNPVQWLAVGATIVPHRSGRLALRMGGTASVCHAIDCSIPWLWNGTDLVQVP